MDAAVVLNPSSLAAVMTVIGVLNGAIALLFRQLIASKDSQIKSLQEEIGRVHAARIQSEERIRREWSERVRSEATDYEERIAKLEQSNTKTLGLLFEAHGLAREATHTLDKVIKP